MHSVLRSFIDAKLETFDIPLTAVETILSRCSQSSAVAPTHVDFLGSESRRIIATAVLQAKSTDKLRYMYTYMFTMIS